MSRYVPNWLGPLAVLVLTGCTMCASTFDQCGPMFDNACPGGCESNSRAGSVLSAAPAGSDQFVEVVGDDAAAVAPEQKKVRSPASSNLPPIQSVAPPTEGWKASKPGQSPPPKR